MKRRPSTATVLLVDDNADELAATGKMLGGQYRVLTATSRQDALCLAREERPSVIVLDVMLSGGENGFTVFHELHGDPATRRIPVIFLTSVGQVTGLPFASADFKQYLGGSPAEFLEKPVAADTLMAAVAKAMRRSDDRT